MITKRILFADTFFTCTFLSAFAITSNAQHTTGFGLGLQHTDTAEIIQYLTRESPLRDLNIAAGDEIVAINGETVRDKDAILAGMLSADTITFRINRKSNDSFFDATAIRTHLRSTKQCSLGMSDHIMAYVQPGVFNPDSIEALEALLDSLANGETGYGKCIDTMNARRDEARQYAFRQNGNRFPARNPYDGDTKVQAFRNDMDYFITSKYGWSMQTLMLDMHAKTASVSPDVLRAIKIFCKERKIALLRQI